MHFMARRRYNVDQAMAQRLKLARSLKYDTATAAAEALGFKQQTYLPYESGLTGFSRHAPRLAERLGVELLWLTQGKGPMKKGGRHPVLEIFESIAPERHTQAVEYLKFLAAQQS